MPLPLLPGLMASGSDDSTDDTADQAAPSGLAAFLDSLDDSQIQELVAAADAYDAANPDADPSVQPGAEDEGPVDPDAVTEEAEPDDAPVDSDANPDEEPAEGDDDQAAPQDLAAVDQQMDADIEQAGTVISQMQELADGDSDSAPDVAKLVKQASALNEKLAKQRKLLDKAMKAEDVQAAAQAGIDAGDTLEAMQALLTAAQVLGTQTVAPSMQPGDHPAIKLWAMKKTGRMQNTPPGA